ncbi:uncharacterized protein LOC114736099 [Neltuma alba]|uniref:uncharacterized protein LOC114736099 n=1 Tax=Neltuma alba TaxID=207710 RepID=UPI0010A42A43|nr:uncharacterized protein LOC114736099 [Prosopis alba]
MRVETTEGDGGTEGGGDHSEGGIGNTRDKDGLLGGGFVFGRVEETNSREQMAGHQEGFVSRRRDTTTSYKDKLLSPGVAGYLVQHDEEEDIVNGWKAYFNQQNRTEQARGEEGGSEEDEVSDCLKEGRSPKFEFSAEEYTAWCKPWMNSLIVKVLGAEIPNYIIRDRVKRMWRSKGPMKIIPLSNGYNIVSFTTREDGDYAYQEGPWMIDDHYLVVQRWRPNFNPWKADVQRKITAWIRLPDLPVEFYNVESLRRIGNMVGKTIKIDRSTSVYDKGGFARICVEIDLQQPLLPFFDAFGEDRPIVYEGLHMVCFHCGRYGHQKDKCPEFFQGHDKGQNDKNNRRQAEDGEDGKCPDPSMLNQQLSETGVSSTAGKSSMSNNVFGKLRILKRDFRGRMSISEIVGLDQDIANVPKSAAKQDHRGIASRSTDNKQGLNDRNKKGNNDRFQKDTDKNRTGLNQDLNHLEWILVGTKRKNVAKGRRRGKENVAPTHVLRKEKEKVGLGDKPVRFDNPFKALQENSSEINLGTTTVLGPSLNYNGGTQDGVNTVEPHTSSLGVEVTMVSNSSGPVEGSFLPLVNAKDDSMEAGTGVA